jgi:hypothetical protein
MNTIAKNIYLFWQGTLLSYKALFAWLRPVTYMASKVLMPLAQMFFFVFLGSYATGGRIQIFISLEMPFRSQRSAGSLA